MAVEAQVYPETLSLPSIPMCGLQDWVVHNNNHPVSSSGFQPDFCFTFQDQQPNYLFLQQQQSSHLHNNLSFPCNRGASSSESSSSSSTFDRIPSMALSQSLDYHLQLERQELDCILQLQNERLRSSLQQQRQQQLVILLKSIESKTIPLIRQKDEDLARATKKSLELEACLRKAQMESDSWQRLARENEAMVTNLSNTLEQVKERLVLVNGNSNKRGEDAESSCCGNSCDETLERSEQERQVMKKACKRCNFRRPCVLFLPCRHLCSCKSCEAFLGFCPVCKSVKEASMEVFWV